MNPAMEVYEPPAAWIPTHSHTRWRSVMNRVHAMVTLFCAVLGLSPLAAAVQQTVKADLSSETVGTESKSFVSVVGVWRIEAENGKNVLTVDGRQWEGGQSS